MSTLYPSIWSSPLSSTDSDIIISSPVSVTIARVESPISVSDQILSVTQDILYAPGPYPYYDQIIYKTPRLITYDNLNKDPKAINMVVKYFWKKTLEKWLYGEFKEILAYLTINNDKVELVKKISNNDKNESQDIINKKIDYLAENIITKKLILKALARYVDDNNVNWYDLPKKTHGPKEEIKRVITAEIKDIIGN